MKVYLCTSGSYSDYKVVVAFTTRELAEQFCEQENTARKEDYGDELQVEELPLYDEMPGPNKLTYWCVAVMNDDGTVREQNSGTESYAEWDEPDHPVGTYETKNRIVVHGLSKAEIERIRAEWVAKKMAQ